MCEELTPFQSEDFTEVRTLVTWLLCFSDLHAEPKYLSLGFYYLYYIREMVPQSLHVGTLLPHAWP